MRLYRFSPIRNEDELIQALHHVHFACSQLCRNAFGVLLPNAGNIAVFCHYKEEYDCLVEIRKSLTIETGNPEQKYFRLHQPILIKSAYEIPETTYTHLYIRKPDPYRHHVGDVDYYLSDNEYRKLKRLLADEATIPGARIFLRNDLDMIELYDPDIDALAYVSTEKMAKAVHVKIPQG